MPRASQILVLLILGVSFAAEQPVPAVPADVKPATQVEVEPTGPGTSVLSPEEKWIFNPFSSRPDICGDLETEMLLRLDMEKTEVEESVGPVVDPTLSKKIWSKQQLERVEACIVARKWDDGMKIADTARKTLKRQENPDQEILQDIEKFNRYYTQMEEAKIFEEAQAKFDALDLQVEGILWSPEGSLAVINGEPRALARDEHVKDCVILTIDTNRVDFLFYYKRRRFEFQRYIDEDSKAAIGATKAGARK